MLREVGLVQDLKVGKQCVYSLDGFIAPESPEEPTQRVTHLTYAVRER